MPFDPSMEFTFELDELGSLRMRDPEQARAFREWLKGQDRLYLTLGPPPPPPNLTLICGEKPITNPRGCPNEECPYDLSTRVNPAIDPVRERPVSGRE